MNSIEVTIPFNYIKDYEKEVGNKVGNKVGIKILNSTRNKVLVEIINNPNITRSELENNCNLSKNTIYKTLTFLKEEKYIKRVGSKKTGYWKVLKSK